MLAQISQLMDPTSKPDPRITKGPDPQGRRHPSTSLGGGQGTRKKNNVPSSENSSENKPCSKKGKGFPAHTQKKKSPTKKKPRQGAKVDDLGGGKKEGDIKEPSREGKMSKPSKTQKAGTEKLKKM